MPLLIKTEECSLSGQPKVYSFHLLISLHMQFIIQVKPGVTNNIMIKLLMFYY